MTRIKVVGLESAGRIKLPAYRYECQDCRRALFGAAMLRHLQDKHGWTRASALDAIDIAASAWERRERCR